MQIVREADQSDSDVINELSHHLGYEFVSSDVAFTRLKTVLESNTEKIWVLETEGVVRGWIHVFIAHRVASPSFAELGGLVVSPGNRREGIGRVLVDCAKKWGAERNLNLKVRCNTQREEADKFYRSIGFTKSKAQNVYEASL